MSGGWIETTVGALVDQGVLRIQTGPFGSQLHSYDYVETGIPVVPTEAIGRRRLKQLQLPMVSSETAERLSRHRLRPGDILFARRGVQATGLSAIIEREQEGWICGTGAMLLRADSSMISTLYLSWLFSSCECIDWLKAHAVGAVMPSLNDAVLRLLPLRLPPHDEQERVAGLLTAIDTGIENGRLLQQTLEDLARRMFKSWFIDFDPVRAKSEGLQSGVPEDLDTLFPATFRDDGLPTGWKLAPLDHVAHFLNGLALQKFPAAEGSPYLSVIKIAQMRSQSLASADRASASLDSAYIVNDGDVLFSWSGSLECIMWTGGRGALNQHLFKVTSESTPPWFYYGWIHEHLETFRAIAAGKATTMGHIQRHHLTEALVALPPREFLDRANDVFEPLWERQMMNRLHSRTLAALRDALLPKLLSGEIRVPDAERMLEEGGA